MNNQSTIKDYHGKKEVLVLSIVKKYPFYSLNRLTTELPGISRHSIQRILEKNSLSTVEKRLEFSSGKKNFFVFEKIKCFFFQLAGKLKGIFLNKLSLAKLSLSLKLIILVSLLSLGGFLVFTFFNKAPQISLERPEHGFVNQGENLFVIGKVVPAHSLVMINGNQVFLNGDGSFTAVVSIPMGEGILEVEAKNFRKKSQVVRLVKRVPTDEEIMASQQEESKKKKEAADRAAQIERTVNDLLAARSAAAQGSILRIINNRIKEEGGFSSVVGEVFNLGTEEVTWVQITASFYDKAGNQVDLKHGFATNFGEVVKPRGKANFETEPTTKPFDRYSLQLSWEKVGVAAGAATATSSSFPKAE